MTTELDTAGPGIETYRSSRYTVTVDDVAQYVYGYTRDRFWNSTPQQHSWVKFGTDSAVQIEITLVGEAITTYAIYPGNIDYEPSLTGGKLTITVPANKRVWVSVNDDVSTTSAAAMAVGQPLLIFAEPLKSAVPSDIATWASLGKTINSIDTGTDTLTFSAPHSLSSGDRVVFSVPEGASFPGGIEEAEPYEVSVVSATEITLISLSAGEVVNITSWSVDDVLTCHKQEHVDTANALYFPAGRHIIGWGFALASDVSVYIDRGAILVGGFNVADKEGISVSGPGMISGEFDTYENLLTLSVTERQNRSPFDGWPAVDGWTNNTVQGITAFALPYHFSTTAAWSYRNCQIVSPWTPNSDGFSPNGQSAASRVSEVVDCFAFCGDDALIVTPYNYNRTVSGCFIVAVSASCVNFGYDHFFSESTTVYTTTISDCDLMYFGLASFTDGSVIRAWVDGPAGDSDHGIFNVTFSDIRVWGPIDRNIFDLRPHSAPWDSIPRALQGQIAEWTISGFSSEYTPALTSTLGGIDATNTVHDLTFTTLSIAGTLVTSTNYETYFTVDSDVYNITWDSVIIPPDPPDPPVVIVVTGKAALWDYVVSVYDADGLITLTNIRDRSATAIDTAVGTAAAASVLALWPAYAQVAYDENDALHREVAATAVIAMLFRRGGAATTLDEVKWDQVFGPDGMITRVRRTDPRGRAGPSSNSGTTTTAESGSELGWSDRRSLPPGFLPSILNSNRD